MKALGISGRYNRPLDHSDEDCDNSVQSTTVRRGRKGTSQNYEEFALHGLTVLKGSLKDKYELDQRGDNLSERENLMCDFFF